MHIYIVLTNKKDRNFIDCHYTRVHASTLLEKGFRIVNPNSSADLKDEGPIRVHNFPMDKIGETKVVSMLGTVFKTRRDHTLKSVKYCRKIDLAAIHSTAVHTLFLVNALTRLRY